MSSFPADRVVPAPDPHEPPRARASRLEREHREALEALERSTERHRKHNDAVEVRQHESSSRWLALEPASVVRARRP